VILGDVTYLKTTPILPVALKMASSDRSSDPAAAPTDEFDAFNDDTFGQGKGQLRMDSWLETRT
jgi:hypothetical protein